MDRMTKKAGRIVEACVRRDFVGGRYPLFSGLTVAQMTELRGQMRKAGANFKVTKNRLTRLALEGTNFPELSEMFTGPTAIAYSNDPVCRES